MCARKTTTLGKQPELDPQQSMRLLREQAAKIDDILALPYDDPEYIAWESFTSQVINKAFGVPNDNINTFKRTINSYQVPIAIPRSESQELHEKMLNALKPLLRSFADQLEIFEGAGQSLRTQQTKKDPILSKKIFIVHGHAEQPKLELARILTQLKFEAIILHEQPSQGLTLIEKLEKYGTDVGYAFVLLTPDDVGAESSILKSKDIDKSKLQHRARQNVVFEFGRFVGLLGRSRVCCLHAGEIEPPSDIDGLVYLPFNHSVNEIQIDIMRELKAAGYEIAI